MNRRALTLATIGAVGLAALAFGGDAGAASAPPAPPPGPTPTPPTPGPGTTPQTPSVVEIGQAVLPDNTVAIVYDAAGVRRVQVQSATSSDVIFDDTATAFRSWYAARFGASAPPPAVTSSNAPPTYTPPPPPPPLPSSQPVVTSRQALPGGGEAIAYTLQGTSRVQVHGPDGSIVFDGTPAEFSQWYAARFGARITPDPPPPPSSTPSYEAQLTAANVQALQTILRAEVAPSLPITGTIDSATRNAVAAFQRREGMPVTGTIDSATANLIVSYAGGTPTTGGGTTPTSSGAQTYSARVRALWNARQAYYGQAPADPTPAGIAAFQQGYNASAPTHPAWQPRSLTVDGLVGPATQAALETIYGPMIGSSTPAPPGPTPGAINISASSITFYQRVLGVWLGIHQADVPGAYDTRALLLSETGRTFGPGTMDAVRSFQQWANTAMPLTTGGHIPVSGYLDPATRGALQQWNGSASSTNPNHIAEPSGLEDFGPIGAAPRRF